MAARAPQVISVNEAAREVTLYQSVGSKQLGRSFHFDKVRRALQPLRVAHTEDVISQDPPTLQISDSSCFVTQRCSGCLSLLKQ